MEIDILKTLIFYGFAGAIILFALLSVFALRILYSLLAAVCVFFITAGIFFMLGADYNAVIQIAIYGIAIPILFVLAIMFTSDKLDKKIYKDIENAGYQKKVFFMERLNNYKTDAQRKDDEEQVKAVHKELHKIYRDLGFELIHLPIFSDDKNTNILKRAELIIKEIKKEEAIKI